MDLVTSACAGAVLFSALGGAALSVLVARVGWGAGGDEWPARRLFAARVVHLAVGACLALSGVAAAVGLAAHVRAPRGATSTAAADEIRDAEVLRQRVGALESSLAELERRLGQR